MAISQFAKAQGWRRFYSQAVLLSDHLLIIGRICCPVVLAAMPWAPVPASFPFIFLLAGHQYRLSSVVCARSGHSNGCGPHADSLARVKGRRAKETDRAAVRLRQWCSCQGLCYWGCWRLYPIALQALLTLRSSCAKSSSLSLRRAIFSSAVMRASPGYGQAGVPVS